MATAGLSLGQLAVVAVAMLVGGVSKGLIGVALPIIAVAIMALALPPKVAIAVMVLPILVTNVQIALSSGLAGLREPVRRFWPLVAACQVSMFAVAYNAARFPQGVIFLCLGAMLALFVALNLSPWKPAVAPEAELRWGLVSGFAAGLLGGASAMFGPPITMYFVAIGLDSRQWLAAVGFTFFMCALPLVAGYVANGMLGGELALVSALAAVPAFAGTWLGVRLQRYVSPAAFRRALLACLAVMAVDFIRRGLA